MKSVAQRVREAGPLGVSLLAAAVALAALVLAAYGFNPVEEAEQEIGEPIASSLGITSERCPDGWDDLSAGADHARAFVCARGAWRVILGSDGKTFSHAVELDRPGAVIVYDPAKVPGWSD